MRKHQTLGRTLLLCLVPRRLLSVIRRIIFSSLQKALPEITEVELEAEVHLPKSEKITTQQPHLLLYGLMRVTYILSGEYCQSLGLK